MKQYYTDQYKTPAEQHESNDYRMYYNRNEWWETVPQEKICKKKQHLSMACHHLVIQNHQIQILAMDGHDDEPNLKRRKITYHLEFIIQMRKYITQC